MSETTGKVEIRVKEYGGTYIATCKSAKMRASCTACAEWAAKACAEKIYGMKGFTLKKVTEQTWIASVKPEAANGN